jgi:hypothetical protein
MTAPDNARTGEPHSHSDSIFSSRLEAFLDELYAGKTPNAGRFCDFCYNPLPPGHERCDHCDRDQTGAPALTSLPPDVLDMYRRKQKRESVVVNSFAYAGLLLALALFLGLIAINVVYMEREFWFFLVAIVILFVAGRLLPGIIGGVIGDEIGYRYARKKLLEDWTAHVQQRRGARPDFSVFRRAGAGEGYC